MHHWKAYFLGSLLQLISALYVEQKQSYHLFSGETLVFVEHKDYEIIMREVSHADNYTLEFAYKFKSSTTHIML